MAGIVGVQFLAALNRFLVGDIEVSRNAMSELFHNLSWQALTNDNDSIILEFDAIEALDRDVNILLQNKIYREKSEQIQRRRKVMEMLSQNFKEETKIDQRRAEENIVDDILNNDQTDYTPIFKYLF